MLQRVYLDILLSVGLLSASGMAQAFEAPSIPEPNVFSLLFTGFVVGLIVYFRNRRK